MRSRLLVVGLLVVLAGTLIGILIIQPGVGPSPSRPPSSSSPSASASLEPPTPPGLAYRDFSFESASVTSLPAVRAQSRAWYARDRWWAGLVEPTTSQIRIFVLDDATQQWLDTGALVDERHTANTDFLWTGDDLFVVASGARATATNAARLSRFSFDPATERFSIDPNFPISLVPTGIGAPVIERDGSGRLWIAYVAEGRVWLMHSLGHDAEWTAPTALTVAGSTVGPDDIAALVPFGPGRLGLMWSSEPAQSVYFSVHEDGAPIEAWSEPEVVLDGLGSSRDRIVPRSFELADGSGRGVVVALKTSLEERQPRNSLDPQIVLALRGADGVWASHLVGQVRDHHGRAMAMVDDEARMIYVAMSAPAGGGAIHYKRSPIDAIAFDTGPGVPLLASATDARVHDATTTKGNLTAASGLLVLASDDDTRRYLHAVVDLGGGAPTADPADPARLDQPAPADPPNLIRYLRDDFEPWAVGPAEATGWLGESGGAPTRLTLIDDGKGRALRVPASRAGVRACRDVPEVGGTTVLVRARVRLSRIGASDATILSVRGSGGETATLRVTDNGVLAWFDRTTKVQTLIPFRPRTWYRVIARVDQVKKTYDIRVTTDGGRRITSAAGLRWRTATVPVLRSVCFATAAAPPSHVIDVSDVSMVEEAPR